MDGRKRTVQIKFRVTEAERDLILEKMKLIPTRNMAAYLRKIAIGIKRAEFNIGLTNLVYNFCRYTILKRKEVYMG